VEVKALEVSLLLWVPPPPSDRLWVSCLQQPKVSLTVTPIVTQAVPQLLEGFQVREKNNSVTGVPYPGVAPSHCS
jgi:hypothetical protein